MTQEAEGWVRRVRRVRAAGVAGVVVVVGVVGCGSPEPPPVPEPVVTATEETPVPTPEETSAAEPTTPPATAGIERPAAMDDPGDAGAIAAAEYFALLVHLTLTADVLDEVRAMSNESCEFCSSIASSTEEFLARGSSYVGGEPEIREGTQILGREETMGVIGVSVPIAVQSAEEWSSDGELVGSWDAVETHLYVEVTHTYLGWLVVGASFSAGLP